MFSIVKKEKEFLSLSKRIITGIKDGVFVFVCSVLLALVLNFMDFDLGHNRFWAYLGNLELITFFDNRELNGLIVLGFILGIVAFVYCVLVPDDNKN
ncbi:hypothetical protein [Staphylococcus equorum]|uniref:hypothetical protein n=1 Tax=Staphylococcus equorum TaxID=246432 RepID=UPI00210B63CC|nr:hypothetical protein [Staphylococcus equorum]MCH4519776.1 hypothetical protein [Staphylococcus haemolyticus]